MRIQAPALLAAVVTCFVLSTQACVGDEAAPPGKPADDAGAGTNADATGSNGPSCRSDQLVCDNACVDINAQHCGSCTSVCPASAPLCSNAAGSTARCVASCGGTETKCGEQCVNTETNPSNCGSCGNKCPTPANGVPKCAGSACDFTCKLGFHACGTDCAADDDVTKCGATCKTCPVPANGTAVCNGSCSFTCASPFTACVVQGTCSNLQTDKNNCGVCGKVCAVAASCTSGACPVTYGNSTFFGESSAPTISEFTAIRIDTTVPITVQKLGAWIREFVSQQSIVLALYNNNGGHPGSLVVATGPILITGTGVQEINVGPVNIAAGTYFIAATQSGFVKFGMTTTAGNYEYYKNVSTFPWNNGTALTTAPATQTLSGTMNYWLVGKEQ